MPVGYIRLWIEYRNEAPVETLVGRTYVVPGDRFGKAVLRA